jgi:hypothetical protein
MGKPQQAKHERSPQPQPCQANILETEITTATRVAGFMFDKGLAQVERPRDIRARIEGQLYKPEYQTYSAHAKVDVEEPHAG